MTEKRIIPEVSEDITEEFEAANARQLDVYEKVNFWYIDWADTLRPELDYHARKKLGLLSKKERKKDEAKKAPELLFPAE